MFRSPAPLALLIFAILTRPVAADEPPRIKSLRVQKQNGTAYFEVQFENLPGLYEPEYAATRGWWTEAGRALTRTPRLVPQDGKTQSVYAFLPHPTTFVGKSSDLTKVTFELLYPRKSEQRPKAQRQELSPLLADLLYGTTWVNVPVTIDFAKAKVVAPPPVNALRPAYPVPGDNDLEALWATAQAKHFALLEALTPEFGFHGFAREATMRKYKVDARPLAAEKTFDREQILRESYALTSGAAAITESLQLHRMRERNTTGREERTVDVKKVPGITIAEHPWEKMMDGKQPTPEPLAKFVPQDNYYLHFKNLAKLIELGELIEQWGGNISGLYDLNSRDYQIKQRYEKQLCLRSTWLGKTLGPLVVRSIAVTGHDPYLREGADVTVLFDCVNKDLLLTAMNQFIQEARQEFGERLRETWSMEHGVKIDIFRTPQREVSLYRAAVGDVVIYANSPMGMRRVLEAHNGTLKNLADSLDFRYMRTVFRLEDKLENGFVFLSDAFIRQLVGPESKIKERRRIEALTSLAMVTNGALFHGWETGKLPVSHAELVKAAHLRPAEIEVPEGRGVIWDGVQSIAVSDAYNTQHFATPLIELPIDRITPTEERDYNLFRQQYMGLWRQFFDPVGMRLQLNKERIRLETYILPLVATSQYNFLRANSGGGVAAFDLSRAGKETLLQWFARINAGNFVQGVGDQFTIRLDDDAVFDQWLDLYLRRQLRPSLATHFEPHGRLLVQMPLTVGLKIGNDDQFAMTLKQLSDLLDNFVGKHDRRVFDHQGISITHIKFKDDAMILNEINRNREPGEPPVRPALYHAKIDGFWYVSFREEPIKSLIDEFRMRGDRLPDSKSIVKGNSALQIAPPAAVKARRAIALYQEWESHCRSVANCSAWHTLFRTNVLPAQASKQQMHDAAKHWFGYVPVSPDLRPYVYLAKFDEVENIWHGSPRYPQMRGGFDQHAPLAQLLAQFKTIRADLRFQEDGVNTVVTIER